MNSQKALVIGIGNPLRGDDGVGWAVIEALADGAEACEVTAGAQHQLLPELIDTIHDATAVIFVDATVEGELGAISVTSIQPASDGPASSHQLQPAVLLALGVELYGRMPPATLITIAGQEFGYEEKLSPPVQQSVAKALRQVYKVIETCQYLQTRQV